MPEKPLTAAEVHQLEIQVKLRKIIVLFLVMISSLFPKQNAIVLSC